MEKEEMVVERKEAEEKAKKKERKGRWAVRPFSAFRTPPRGTWREGTRSGVLALVVKKAEGEKRDVKKVEEVKAGGVKKEGVEKKGRRV